MTTSRVGIDYMSSGAGGEILFNQLVNFVDCIVGGVVSITTNVASPSNGESYIVATGGTGAFADKDNYLATYFDGWTFIEPKEGMNFWVISLAQSLYYNGDHWTTPGPSSDGVYKLTTHLDTTYYQLPEDIYFGWGEPDGGVSSGTAADDNVILRMLPVNPAIGKTILFLKNNSTNAAFTIKPSTSASPTHTLVEDATGLTKTSADIPKNGYRKFVYVADSEWRYYEYSNPSA